MTSCWSSTERAEGSRWSDALRGTEGPFRDLTCSWGQSLGRRAALQSAFAGCCRDNLWKSSSSRQAARCSRARSSRWASPVPVRRRDSLPWVRAEDIRWDHFGKGICRPQTKTSLKSRNKLGAAGELGSASTQLLCVTQTTSCGRRGPVWQLGHAGAAGEDLHRHWAPFQGTALRSLDFCL